MSKKSRKLENRAKKQASTAAKVVEKAANPIVPQAITKTQEVVAAPRKVGVSPRAVGFVKSPIVEAEKVTPVQAKVQIIEDQVTGIVAEVVSDNGKLLYAKVVTPHPITGELISVLAHKPGVILPLGAKVSFKLEPYFAKWSAKNVTVVETTTKYTPYLEQIANIKTDCEETDATSALFPSQIVSALLEKKDLTGNLAVDLGFTSVLGRVPGGSKLQFA